MIFRRGISRTKEVNDVHYEMNFTLCALIFLIVIAVRFFSMRRFPNAQNRLFGIILYLAIADLTLDIVGSLTIEYAAVLPVWVNYVVNTQFYLLQTVFPTIMVIYVLVLRDRSLKNIRGIRLLFIPCAVCSLLILTSPLTHLIFYISTDSGTRVYTRGLLYNYLYLGSGFYIALTLFISLKSRQKLMEKQFSAIIAFIVIIVTAIIIQYYYPAYMLTGVAITLAILMMYFTLQNPEDMLDLISGVFNYNAMMAFLDIQISEKRQLWLVAVDVGGIRRVNSAFGVSVGNDCFVQIGDFFNRLEGKIWAFRMIGTRFLLVASSDEEYRRIIEEIEARFQDPWHIGNTTIMLSVTIRYFSEWDFFKSPEDVVNLVDVAYSGIGADGWGSKRRISTELMLRGKRSLAVESAIREALNTGTGFSLCYQPLFKSGESRFSQVEILLRLDSPELGRIPPSEFIPVAERTGLILQIDELVIQKACAFYTQNERDLRGVLTCLNINLSAAEFYKNPNERIHGLVRDARVPPELICFEVTETAATTHPSILAGFMNDMICRGYRFALDDFGTGYANLSRMVTLPFETVKLDRSMLLPEDEKSQILFSGMLQVFSEIGVSTVVEGIETPEQAQRASLLGADMVQGFHYATPMREEELIALLRERDASDL